MPWTLVQPHIEYAVNYYLNSLIVHSQYHYQPFVHQGAVYFRHQIHRWCPAQSHSTVTRNEIIELPRAAKREIMYVCSS